MSILNKIRILARKFGIEINRYNVIQSDYARTGIQLAYHNVDCVIDVGANDGGYGEFIRSTGFKCNIVSFEPQSEAYQKLLVNSKGYTRWYVASRMALGDTESELEINIAGNSVSSSLLEMLHSHEEEAPQSKFIGKEKVAVHRLDGLDDFIINDAKRIYLKIDTQGYELPVLQGSQGIMDRVVGVQLEMSVIPLYKGQALYQDLIAWLEKAGFEMWGVQPGFMNKKTGQMLQFDSIFFKTKTDS